MAPPIDDVSDDESTGDAIPFESAENGKKDKVKEDKNKASEVEESGEDEEEGVYVVEKIMDHLFAKDGTLLLTVKWKGYDDPKDQTVEPEENLLEGAEEALAEYFEKLGGRPKPPEKPSKKRKSMGERKSTPDSTAKRSRKSRGANGTETPEGDDSVPDWVPDSKNWEREVTKVETITRDQQTGGLMAYLQWQNGKKSRVSIEQCYEKIPMKMLKFYEQHLVFKEA